MAEENKTSLQDVARPGTIPALATSKPVIVGHTSMVADPMMNADKKDSGSTAPATSVVSAGSTKPKLEPISAKVDTKSDESKDADKSQALHAADTTKISEQDLRQEKLAELIESGEYKVSVHHQKSGSNSIKTFVLTVFAIILAGLAVLFVLTDLKVIDLGVKLPFHIFKQ